MEDSKKVNNCMIIAEAGVNHNGNLELALDLCDEAKNSGADVVKFQTWKTENIITREVAQAEYQKCNTGKIETQYDMLKRLELSYDDFRIIRVNRDLRDVFVLNKYIWKEINAGGMYPADIDEFVDYWRRINDCEKTS